MRTPAQASPLVLLSLAVLAALAALAGAAVYLEPEARSADHPGGCFSHQYNMPMKFGKVYQLPSHCGDMVCDKSFMVRVRTCGVVGVGEGCHLQDGDLSLPYPACCPDAECDPPPADT